MSSDRSNNRIGQNFVTQRMVAEAAGVHISTVSLALRNHPSLPTATCERIRAAAENLGYTPDPLVSVLMARVRKRSEVYRGTLAFVHTGTVESCRPARVVHRKYFAGAAQRASELGYRLDEIHLSPPAAGTPDSIGRILEARGIVGIVVVHYPNPACPDHNLRFDVSAFPTASIGVPIVTPHLHYVANDQYMRPVIAARELLRLGYRRLGLIIDDLSDRHMSRRLSAGFWAVQQSLSDVEPVPILRVEGVETAAPKATRIIARWLDRQRPDVLLTPRDWVLESLNEVGVTMPGDVGFVNVDWMPNSAPAAGVYGNSERIGAAAVEMVVAQIYRGERGPPASPATHLVAGSWVEGTTVRRVGAPADLDAAFFAGVTRD